MVKARGYDFNVLVFLPVAVGLGYLLTKNDLATALILVGYLVGGFLLSPADLGLCPYSRWGFLRWLWEPYKRVIPHDRWYLNKIPFSHAPIVGTVSRVVYVGLIVLLLVFLIDSFVIAELGKGLWDFINQNKLNILYSLIGLEASAWVHLGIEDTN